MEANTVTQLITVGATLSGVILTGIFSLVSQKITQKNDNYKLKKQLTFKLVEEELKDKRTLIKPLMIYFNSLNLPRNYDFINDDQQLERMIIQKCPEIKEQISQFLLDYVIYLDDNIKSLIWNLTNSINDLNELESHYYDLSLSGFENEEIFLCHCSDLPSKVWSHFNTLMNKLYDEISISNKL
ncbi:hypothetical protein [Kluyvera ascorbata]|uniref:hypothetical protein n=1 Tax=Kluyvera ascorbata TaxID=51288 RepID=UPI000E0849D9|nr:hypothetical protein [Kluyvera ascorbata]EJG2388852.1 hypothetical protein [Kluyvera ascorbata]MDU1198430.1 hypothetical protein [Kluyvera ascorbata]BCA40329.1 hypothetical protein KATP_28510 [Kluyvera ascorbata]STX00284.1 Uncharacterised protein [Kluyvera ascorbata]